MGALPKGAEGASAPMSKELKSVIAPRDVGSMTLPPAKVESK